MTHKYEKLYIPWANVIFMFIVVPRIILHGEATPWDGQLVILTSNGVGISEPPL